MTSKNLLSSCGFHRPGLVLGVFALGISTRALGGSFEAADVLALPWHNFVFRPQLSVQNVATDNVFYGNNSVVASAVYRPLLVDTNSGTLFLGSPTTNSVVLRSQESDLITYISPGFELEYGANSANKISLTYTLDELFYLSHPEEDSEQHRFVLNTIYQSGAFSIRGKDGYSLLSTPLGGGSYVSLATLVVDRRLWEDAYTFQVDLTEKSSVYAKGSHYSLDFKEGLPVYDTDTLSGSLGWAYNPAALLALTIEGYYGQSSLGSNTPLLTKGPHSEVMGASVGARGEFTPKIQGFVRVGVESRSFPGLVNGPSIFSPAVDASLTYSMTPLTQGILNFSRKTDLSGFYSGQTLIANSVSLSVQQALGSSGRWAVIGRTSGTLLDYSNVDLPVSVYATDSAGNILFDRLGSPRFSTVLANYGRSETMVSAGLQLMYQPRPWLQVSLAYDFIKFTPSFRDSRVGDTHPSIDYTDNRATFRIAIGF